MNKFSKFTICFIAVFGLMFFLFNVNKAEATPGASCSDLEPCDTGEYCVSAQCRTGELDSVCRSNDQCDEGLQCVDYRCRAAGPDSGTGDTGTGDSGDTGGTGTGDTDVANTCRCSTTPQPNVSPAPDSLEECCSQCNKESGESVMWNETETTCTTSESTSVGSVCGDDNPCSSGQQCISNQCVSTSGTSGTGSGGGVQDYEGWRQRQIAAADSAERGIFTEGLTTECMAFGTCGTCDIMKVVANVFRFVFEIVGIVAVAVLAMGGFAYVRSGGSEETIGQAKKTIMAAIFGTLIVFAAWVIINTILNITGFNVGGGTWWNPSC
jgi:hypothetical protein